MQELNQSSRPRVIILIDPKFDDWRLLYNKMDRLVENLNQPIICTRAISRKMTVADEWTLRRKFWLSRYHVGIDSIESLIAFAIERRPAFLVAFTKGRDKETNEILKLARKSKIKLRIIEI